MVSEKAYEFDHKRSFTFKAHGYIRKPLHTETFSVQVNRILNDHIDMRFGRRRGTVSGETALKYVGNTSWISIKFPRQQLFVFDGGSEIKALGDWLASQQRKRIQAKVFI